MHLEIIYFNCINIYLVNLIVLKILIKDKVLLDIV